MALTPLEEAPLMARMIRITAAILVVLATTSHAASGEYGAPMPSAGDAVSLATAIARANADGAFEGKIRGRVTEVCRKKGCFMILADAAHYARVTFKDYRFFVPTDTRSVDSTVFGRLEAVSLTRAEAAQFAADAGRDPSGAAATREYSIVATSVVLD